MLIGCLRAWRRRSIPWGVRVREPGLQQAWPREPEPEPELQLQLQLQERLRQGAWQWGSSRRERLQREPRLPLLPDPRSD